MSLLAEGIWGCTVLSASFGENDKGIGQVQVNVRFDDGPSAGRQATYQDEVNAKSALYIGRSCKAIGWTGRDLTTLTADAKAWIEKTGGKSTAEVKHIPIKNGKRAGEIWDKVNSIGRGAKPLAPPKQATLADANDAMRRAMADDGGAPEPGTVDDDSMPFASSAFNHEP